MSKMPYRARHKKGTGLLTSRRLRVQRWAEVERSFNATAAGRKHLSRKWRLRIGYQLCQGIQSLAQPEWQSSADGLEVTRAKPHEMHHVKKSETAALCEH